MAIARTIWNIGLYDIDGNSLLPYNDYFGNSSDFLRNATGCSIELTLNGVDSFNFTIFLDDPVAPLIRRLTTIVKVWRYVYDENDDLIYNDVDGLPVFAGVIAQTTKSGTANTMSVRAFSPLWRLQSRFHILNHYLVTNPNTDAAWKQSELMWYLVYLINNAFGSTSFTGIDEGYSGDATAIDLTDEVDMAPYFVGRGTNTWAHIFDYIMSRPGGVDIIPVYVHTEGDSTLMLFDTALHRGTARTVPIFTYHSENPLDNNLDDMVETTTVSPGKFGNYLWAVGQGGPNSGKVVVQENTSGATDSDGMDEIGIYMVRDDKEDIKKIGLEGPPATDLWAVAEADFALAQVPETAYEVTLSPVSDISYTNDFVLGDVVTLYANKGVLFIDSVQQRIYQVTLSKSDNNVETCSCLISKDFYGKVPT